ncbi:tetrapyrrole biosynthesis, uroporphyrinogen III synthase [Diplogelasinospora grovesii]|uniref:Tetrapyrrole biosynthesis, uroporphyrinogen III synthase n=1 Tax=Diplogelasinospora grovesii TaxID=303347 RepID=A0AAN6S619_9PEZI|nr:tetrapyrrole biosynthesis, uroporphyrinogen III synthase [Diplogelasinospora grovesii]
MSEKTPVFLLKTKSTPSDAYEDLFSTTPTEGSTEGSTGGFDFEPTFVPVLEHRFDEDGLAFVRDALQNKNISPSIGCEYGGLIFTSQRAVEAFAKVVDEGKGKGSGGEEERGWPHLQGVPIYSVGPATTRALTAIRQEPEPLRIFGEHTGNGENLAQFILNHYADWYEDRAVKPPLLFLVGEQRRDIIPKTLMDPALPAGNMIRVDERVVYGTGVMESFRQDFQQLLQNTKERPRRWVVVFSPTGCDTMLSALGLLDEKTGKARPGGQKGTESKGSTYIATIGPTTRDYLKKTFDFEPDVCAEKPSPDGIWQGITRFERDLVEKTQGTR